MSEKKIKTEKAFVAFIDLLGASQLMEKNSDSSLEIIHNCYECVKEYIFKWEKESFPIPQIKIFSDNIILSIPLNNLESDKSLFSGISILIFSIYLQVYFWMNNLLVRGAITIGSYFQDDMIAWGSGLVKAHCLESSIAIYPRIIIDPEIEKFMEELCDFFKTQLLTQDFDGIYFIDPYTHRNSRNIESLIDDFIIDNEKRIEENKGNYKILQKLNWLQNYFNEKTKNGNSSAYTVKEL